MVNEKETNMESAVEEQHTADTNCNAPDAAEQNAAKPAEKAPEQRLLNLACGSSMHEMEWRPRTTTFDRLCERLENPIRTDETVAEYSAMSKEERAVCKDHGGFVAGLLNGPERRQKNVQSRSMLTLDVDHAGQGFLEEYKTLSEYVSFLYSTHTHTPQNPRFRLLVPLTRDVTPDEYVAISRYYANEWNITRFDPCSWIIHQMMFWPSCPSDGEYLCARAGEKWLDPDVFLAKYPNWRDCSKLPTLPGEEKPRENAGKMPQDPTEKEGIVGAFCRCYSIEDAIDTFLNDVYQPAEGYGDRYEYIPAESRAGVVLFDGKFAYSHHATDPAHQQMLNAFDLVRVHLFPDEDEKKSFRAMVDFALQQDDVKLLYLEERAEAVRKDFAAVETAEEDTTSEAGDQTEAENKNWRARLEFNRQNGEVKNTVANEVLILMNDPNCKNFAFNQLAGRVQVTGPMAWSRPEGNRFWRDADTAQLKAYLDACYTVFSERNHNVAFATAADRRRFHPVRDYLAGLPAWDGTKRVETLLINTLGAEDSAYVRGVTRKTMAAAVARAMNPGTKFDSVLVLDGIQGIGKSTLFKELAGEEFYSETLSLTDMNDKSGAEKLQGFWIVEIAELAGMRKADVEKVKAFLSTSDDQYRPSYGTVVESHPRQCIVIASVNGENGYLRDLTGNRRFWVVKLGQKEQGKKWSFTKEERDQIWAEAKSILQSGEKLWLEGDLIPAAEAAQQEAMEEDERTGIVEDYLNTLLPADWDSMSAYDRRSFLHNKGAAFLAGEGKKGTVLRTSVSNQEIWCECFQREKEDMDKQESYKIAGIMAKVKGWKRTDTIRRLPIYGRQRIYMRQQDSTGGENPVNTPAAA